MHVCHVWVERSRMYGVVPLAVTVQTLTWKVNARCIVRICATITCTTR